MEQGLLLPLHQDPVLSEGMSLEELVQLLRQARRKKKASVSELLGSSDAS